MVSETSSSFPCSSNSSKQTPNSTSFSCSHGFSVDSNPNIPVDGLIPAITVLQGVLLSLMSKSKEQSKDSGSLVCNKRRKQSTRTQVVAN